MTEEQDQDTLLSENKYSIVKGRFKSQDLNLFGIFYVIFNPDERLESYNIVVSTYSSTYALEPQVEWDRYEETILDMKWKGNYNPSMTNPLMEQIKNISADERTKSQLLSSVKGYDFSNVEIFMSDIIYRILHDKNLVIEIGIQDVSPGEFTETREKRLKSLEPADTQKRGYNLEDGAVVLNLKPLLAPVKGKPLYELRVGDKIVARIHGNAEREKYFIDLLGLRSDDQVRPVPCEVIDIKANSRNDPIEILVQIGPGIYGKIIEEERQVKFRMYDPQIDGPMTKKGYEAARAASRGPVKREEAEPGVSMTTYIVVGLLMLVLLIFSVLIFISF